MIFPLEPAARASRLRVQPVLKTNSDVQPFRSDETREFYTVKLIASLLQLNEMTVYGMVKDGDLASYAIGRMKRFRRYDIEKFLDDSRIPAEVKKPRA